MAIKRYRGPFRHVVKDKVLTLAQPMNSVTTLYGNTANQVTFESPGVLPASIEHYDTLITPNFNKVREEGYIVQCPFVKTRSLAVAVPGQFREDLWAGTNRTYSWNTYTNLCPLFQGASSMLTHSGFDRQWSAAYDESLTRVFSKANSANADLLIDLSQIKQTVMMFVNAWKTFSVLVDGYENFAKVGTAILKGRDRYVRVPPDGRKVPVSSLAGYWCELRFGWGPLLGSLQGIAEALTRLDLNQMKRTTYRAQEAFTYVEEKSKTNTLTWTSGCINLVNEPVGRTFETYSYESKFRAGILLEASTTLAQALGLDAKNIPIALWDLVRLSFIVDRFINVGNWIRSMHPIPALSFGGSWVTEQYKSIQTRRDEYIPVSRTCGTGSTYRQYVRSGGSTSSGLIQFEGYRRIIHERPPSLPVLRHDWSSILNIFNLVDAVMLAIQRFTPPPLRRRR